ncbi:MAG: hypothetical protein ACXADF_18920, partial [Candidatus Thorarchaeota archaeon]
VQNELLSHILKCLSQTLTINCLLKTSGITLINGNAIQMFLASEKCIVRPSKIQALASSVY